MGIRLGEQKGCAPLYWQVKGETERGSGYTGDVLEIRNRPEGK